MTSILTNLSAMSALQTLRTVSSGLQKTQAEVSSGLSVAIASDNVAYWSISTTMRSDNKALSSASDALGLGSAKVDTAYAGMDAVIDVLAEFRAKLVTAKEDSVDKAKIQTELDELKKQVGSIATSASFNGENWLNTDIADIYDSELNTSSVVSAFVRDSSGVSIKMMETDLSGISLFNTTGGGLLQGDRRDLGAIGGLRNALVNYQGGPASYMLDFSSPLVFDTGDAISFKMTVDADNPAEGISAPYIPGKTTNIEITKDVVNTVLGKTDGTISNYKDYSAVLNRVLSGSGAAAMTYWKYDPPNQTKIRVDIPDIVGIVHSGVRNTDGRYAYDGSSMQITDLNVVGLTTTNEINNGSGTSGDGAIRYGTGRASQALSFEPLTVYDGLTVSTRFKVNNETVALSFDQDYVNSVLGIDDGVVATADDMATLLNSLINRTDIIIESAGSTISVKTDPLIDRKSGDKSSVGFYGASVSNEPLAAMDFLDIDIEQNPDLVDDYLSYVEVVTAKVIDGAAVLGAFKQRIDMQTDFASRLMDSIDSGVSRLVDTDMEEASARLEALQTQQQLAIQSLQIANSQPEIILNLFN